MSTTRLPLAVANAAEATFDCSYGRGCDGPCCRNGRPGLSPEELTRIRDQLPRLLPLLRPDARAVVEAGGFVSNRTKLGRPMVRVSAGWCLFFNGGCVLHKLGAADGDVLRYKPLQCALFPLEKDPDDGQWYVRQWGYRDEGWDLFCLNPANSRRPAVEGLAGEIALAATGIGDDAFEPQKACRLPVPKNRARARARAGENTGGPVVPVPLPEPVSGLE